MASHKKRLNKKEQMKRDLQQAIEMGELILYYQSKVNMSTGDIVGAEALIRWKKGKEIITPDQFIPFAEESGLIIKISDWVLEEACWQMKRWQGEGYFIPVAVNISAVEFYQSHLIQRIKSVLEKTGIRPEFLEIELTETIAMAQVDEAIKIMQKIRDLGITIALDDFGTGYSSLSYLKELLIQHVKLDRMFLKNITSDKVSCDIVRAIIELTQILGLTVIAEGVEEVNQQKLLGELGCIIGQGYLFGYPKAEDEWLRDLQLKDLKYKDNDCMYHGYIYK